MGPSSHDRGLVLVVDDDEDMTDLVAAWLGKEGYTVDVLHTGSELTETLDSAMPIVVLLDVQLPDRSGLELLAEMHATHPSTPVVMLTANRDVDVVVKAMQSGALDYVAKPFERTRLVAAVANAADRGRLQERVRQLEALLRTGSYRGIVGRSPAIQRVFQELDHVVASEVTVLVLGESGTGKELVARALHEGGRRVDGPFIAVNCAAIPGALVESELFGHERGAFTNATARHEGNVERANGGTLFLDEIAELPLGVQAKLLRVLQERTFRRVGGTVDLRSDFRLVCATHRDLRDAVRAGRFREDLYYRLAVFELELPALRERSGDVALLAEHVVRSLAPGNAPRISPEALAALEAHDWPGNVRELRNAIERSLVVCAGGPIGVEHLPSVLRASRQPAPAQGEGVSRIEGSAGTSRPPASSITLDDIERDALKAALERCGGNVSAAVRELGIGRTTVYRKMKKYGLG